MYIILAGGTLLNRQLFLPDEKDARFSLHVAFGSHNIPTVKKISQTSDNVRAGYFDMKLPRACCPPWK